MTDPDFTDPVDDTLVAVRVVRDGATSPADPVLATLTNYGCHPQSLGPANSLVSADWPGTTRQLLETEFGGTSLFLLGACGETGPVEQCATLSSLSAGYCSPRHWPDTWLAGSRPTQR